MEKLIFLNREISAEDNFINSIIVPLSSTSMRDVLLKEKEYIKLENFIDYNFCAKNKEKIWQLFQRLLDKADEIVSQIYENHKIKSYGPFNLFAMGIRQMFDTMVQNYLIFNNIVTKIRPIEIELWTKELVIFGSEITVDNFINDLDKVILGQIAAINNINLSYYIIEAKQEQNVKKIYKRNILMQKAINLIKKSNIYYYTKREINEFSINKINEKALFLQHDWGVYYYSQYFTQIINDFKIEDFIIKNENSDQLIKISCTEILEKLQNEILPLNDLFGFDLKFIIEETFKRYIKRVPVIISRALRSEEYLSKLNPRYVFYTNLYGNMLPFQMALCWNNKIIKVIKQHGDSMFDITVWRNNELKPANIYLTENNEIKEYCKTNAELSNNIVKCENDGIRVNKYYWKKKRKKKLVYVPGFFDHRLSFDMERIPQPLYYRIQTRILHVLNLQDDLDDVVYKCLPPGQHEFHYPIPEYITKHFKNIRISEKKLIDELRDSMFCLVDAPLSSMWEAINMDVPCQALIWNKIHLRPTAVVQYDKYLTFYNSDGDVSEKLISILKAKRFHALDVRERKHMKRSADDITAIFLNAMSCENLS
jgi:hypothetical protein